MDGTRDRVAYLLRAARRAEGEGNARAARIFRLMARDARPAEVSVWTAGGLAGEG